MCQTLGGEKRKGKKLLELHRDSETVEENVGNQLLF